MIKGNGLKRKSEKKRKEVEVVDKIIHDNWVSTPAFVSYSLFDILYQLWSADIFVFPLWWENFETI